MGQHSLFRAFVLAKWYEHRKEVFCWTKKYPEGTAEQYFTKYKWYLKSLFKLGK